ncbi:MAG: hypothetical protein JWO67_3978 [Streptosporangiaceae bacterium]|nr:hypothetical protein [Streptosporangiaceae bacterium]
MPDAPLYVLNQDGLAACRKERNSMLAYILRLLMPAVYGSRREPLVRWAIIWMMVVTLVLVVRVPMS